MVEATIASPRCEHGLAAIASPRCKHGLAYGVVLVRQEHFLKVAFEAWSLAYFALPKHVQANKSKYPLPTHCGELHMFHDAYQIVLCRAGSCDKGVWAT